MTAENCERKHCPYQNQARRENEEEEREKRSEMGNGNRYGMVRIHKRKYYLPNNQNGIGNENGSAHRQDNEHGIEEEGIRRTVKTIRGRNGVDKRRMTGKII